jgi:phosphoglucomutase
MAIDPRAGQPAQACDLIDVSALLDAYAALRPDPSVAAQRVAFGTSGHRGSSLDRSFNEWHVLSITQAICEHRRRAGVNGPLFLGIDTHALSVPAFRSALEVLAANGVDVLVAANDEFTPTPAVSHAILVYNRARPRAVADGILVTPSHNPPDNGGFKYNPPNGGPADTDVTGWIEARANALIDGDLRDVRRIPFKRARRAPTTREHDFASSYTADLASVVDFEAIRDARIRMGVDPLGGAGVHYWGRIAERYALDLTVVNAEIDPTFRFMTLDWDGRIRMDPSSSYAMQRVIAVKDRFDIAFACDTDHDRHGIVTPGVGLLPANHYLAAAADYLFRNRPQWRSDAAVGKTIVSTAMIDRVAKRLGRPLYEVPVGFKWFVDGLLSGTVGFAGEESAGATFLRQDGSVWTTDKDGIVPCLLSAEMLARTGRDPGALYRELTAELGAPVGDRIDAAATPAQKRSLAQLSAARIPLSSLAGEPIEHVLDRAPGNGAPIGGIKVVSSSGWFAARPSGTESIYKIYAESFRNEGALAQILADAQRIVDAAIADAR